MPGARPAHFAVDLGEIAVAKPIEASTYGTIRAAPERSRDRPIGRPRFDGTMPTVARRRPGREAGAAAQFFQAIRPFDATCGCER